MGREEVQYILLFAYKGFALVGKSHRVQKRRRGGVEGEWVSRQTGHQSGWILQNEVKTFCIFEDSSNLFARDKLFITVFGLMKIFKC